MKVIQIKLTDEEYRQLEDKARQEGYVLLSEYVRSVLLGRQTTVSNPISIDINNADVINQITNKLERKIIDYINPFTSQIEELKRKIAELTEKIEELESNNKSIEKTEEKRTTAGSRILETKREQQPQQPKKRSIERLQEEGIVFESELKSLRDPSAFFAKLEREGAKIIYLETERIAMSQDFYNKFLEDISTLNTSDLEEAASKLDPKEAKLFRKLAREAFVIYDANSKGWRLTVQL
ncbi:plasmid mobilization protein [Stygiolobus caldivivus]|uniref:CopG family transcriptional regulator n=1 Tax=Stygiolobus caldivivus TaxID=2824673 RepID=A0A8D5U713_9CREN|nr:hypothetical protein [Stygiolobus caldivivus]BCU70392.1 hypothetical protein KN1_16890 [Stygiolobus caldivivus]